jgi:tyrosyl-tRNA synthetase
LETAEKISQGGIPDDVEEIVVEESEIGLLDALLKTKATNTKSEARRLVEQGGVMMNDEKLTDPKLVLNLDGGATVLKVGKRKFYRIVRK